MMTETTTAPVEYAAEQSDSKKPLIIAGCLGGALLLAGAGFYFLKGGSSTESLPPVVKHVVKQKPAAAPKSAAGKPLGSNVKPTRQLPAASAVKIGRDPFAALYMLPTTPAGSAGTPAAAGTSTTTSSSTSGTTTPAGGSSAAGSSTDTSNNARYSIVLKKITRDPGGAYLYTFTAEGKTKTVLTAQRFGKYGELVVLTVVKSSRGVPTGVVLQVGDDNPTELALNVKTSVQ